MQKLTTGIRTQNKTNKNAVAVPEREKTDNQWVPSNQIHRNLNLERKKQSKFLPSSLDWGTIGRELGELTGDNSLPLLASTGSRMSCVSQWSPSVLPGTLEVENSFYLYMSELHTETLFFPSRVPCKWISSSRLKDSHSDNYNSRLYLVSLTYLFRQRYGPIIVIHIVSQSPWGGMSHILGLKEPIFCFWFKYTHTHIYLRPHTACTQFSLRQTQSNSRPSLIKKKKAQIQSESWRAGIVERDFQIQQKLRSSMGLAGN